MFPFTHSRMRQRIHSISYSSLQSLRCNAAIWGQSSYSWRLLALTMSFVFTFYQWALHPPAPTNTCTVHIFMLWCVALPSPLQLTPCFTHWSFSMHLAVCYKIPVAKLTSGFIFYSAIDDDCQLTKPLGVNMAEFPLSPMFARMLLTSG